jgi:hypothetical protein
MDFIDLLKVRAYSIQDLKYSGRERDKEWGILHSMNRHLYIFAKWMLASTTLARVNKVSDEY